MRTDNCARRHHHQSTERWRGRPPRLYDLRQLQTFRKFCGRKRKPERLLSELWRGRVQNQRLSPGRQNAKEELVPRTDLQASRKALPLDYSNTHGQTPVEHTYTYEDEFFGACVECSEPTTYSNQTEVVCGLIHTLSIASRSLWNASVHSDPPCRHSD